MKSPRHSLILIPWHLGDRADITLGAVFEVRRLRCLLVEDEASCRRELEGLGVDPRSKLLLPVGDRRDPALLKKVLALLRQEDIGMVSSGGTPGFVDPGAWLIPELRRLGIPVRARGGASSLAVLLSLTGYDWISRPRSRAFSFVFYDGGPRRNAAFGAILGRPEPVVVFLERSRFPGCLRVIARRAPKRPVTAFFDLTKRRCPERPYADRVETMSPADWVREQSRIDWSRVDDVALLVETAGKG